MAKELIEEVGELDVLVAATGGRRIAVRLHYCSQSTELELQDCWRGTRKPETTANKAYCNGQIVHIDPPKTIADGAQTQHLGEYTFPIIYRLVDDIVTVGDDELADAMRFFAHTMKMVVEPTGCLAAAAVLGKKLDVSEKRVGIVVSGGNVDLLRFTSLISHGPA